METISCAICEDEKKVLLYLRTRLSESLPSDSLHFSFDCFTSGISLLRSVEHGTQYQIIFLDIDMPEMNGIELCRKIRAFSEDILAVFVSNKEEMVFQTFEVQPFRFIRKNHFNEELPALCSDLRRALVRRKGTVITITEQHSSTVYSLNINEILYIEILRKHCRIVMQEKELTVRYRLTDLVDILQPYGFLQPHRSYLVNCRYIFSIEATSLTLDDQTNIPLSRNRVKEVKAAFMNYTRSE